MPQDLRQHQCLVFRSSGGAFLDRWSFAKGAEQVHVDVPSRFMSHHGTWVYEAACAGAGVIRGGDLTLIRYLSAGLLVPALTDWEALDSPSYLVVYRPGQRRSKLVRAFIDFLVGVFADLELQRALMLQPPPSPEPMPEWFGRARGRQSAYVARHGYRSGERAKR